jgi:hypothetical protein
VNSISVRHVVIVLLVSVYQEDLGKFHQPGVKLLPRLRRVEKRVDGGSMRSLNGVCCKTCSEHCPEKSSPSAILAARRDIANAM